ncbi:MAG: preprotein translocase subunit SecG [Bacteroidota bacterium]
MAVFSFFCIVISIALTLVVIVQNSKGGGLSSTFGGGAQQIMGARRSNELIEKVTWVLAGSLAAVALIANLFVTAPNADLDSIRSEQAIDELVVPNAGPLQDPASLPEAAPSGEAPEPSN